jgi:hypothetical protein
LPTIVGFFFQLQHQQNDNKKKTKLSMGKSKVPRKPPTFFIKKEKLFLHHIAHPSDIPSAEEYGPGSTNSTGVHILHYTGARGREQCRIFHYCS